MRRRGEAGNVLPLIALSLAVLMGFAGIAVDVGFLEYRQQVQQTATDAAAAGGAGALLKVNCPNQTAATNAANQNAANNGFTNGSNGVSITVVNPPTGGPFAGNPCAVDVTMKTAKVPTFFSRLYGYGSGMDESTHAVAIVSSTGAGCIYLLSMTVVQNFNGANLTAAKCGVLINNTANFNGASIGAYGINYAGGTPNENGAHFTEAQPGPMLPVADPCPEIAGCNYLAANPPPIANCTSFNGNGYSGALAPGCYSNLNLNGATVTMSGTYILNGPQNYNGATITGTGVTLYVPASGSAPNFNGAHVTLSPPTTGNTAGVLYYQVPTNTGNPNFNGASESYSGLIYAPGANGANFNGANGGYLVLVFGGANFNGGTAMDFATPPPEQSLVKTAVVAQ